MSENIISVANGFTEFTGVIERFYANCPKADGWFGGFFREENGTVLRVTGKTDKPLRLNKKYMIMALEDKSGKYDNCYAIRHIEAVVNVNSASHVIKFLSSRIFPGIGVSTAAKIYEKFGKDSLTVIANNPERLRTELNLSKDKIDFLVAGIHSDSVLPQLMRLAPSLSDEVIERLINHYGRDILEIVKKRPYECLYADPKIKGLTFRKMDDVAIANGLDKEDSGRIHECMRYVLDSMCEEEHHTYLNISDAYVYNRFLTSVLKCIDSTAISQNDLVFIMNDLIAGKSNYINIIVEEDYVKNEYHLYDIRKQKDETLLARTLANMTYKKAFLKGREHDISYLLDSYCTHQCPLDAGQIEAVLTSLLNRVSVITGGPGRGKTSVVKALLYVWESLNHKTPVLLAPTGKAVCRLEEATGKTNGMTIARCVCRAMTPAYATDMLSYQHNLVIIDECSMIGNKMACDMMQLFKDSQVVFVGDVDQLPSIEYGQFFRDVCNTDEIAKTRLMKNHRSKGFIVPNADKINAGEPAESMAFDYVDHSFELWNYDSTGADYSDILVGFYLDKVMSSGVVHVDMLSKVCILCPAKNYSTGTRNINAVLQDKVNPWNEDADVMDRGYSIPLTSYKISDTAETTLRVGDRVICTKNHAEMRYTTKTFSVGEGIANGDCGMITRAKRVAVTVADDFTGNAASNNVEYETAFIFVTDDGRQYEIMPEYFDEFDLAYAMTVHKSQGSEYDTVIFSSMYQLANWGDFATRNLLYTAVTRAKNRVSIIGSLKALNVCIHTEQKLRNSALSRKIAEAI